MRYLGTLNTVDNCTFGNIVVEAIEEQESNSDWVKVRPKIKDKNKIYLSNRHL